MIIYFLYTIIFIRRFAPFRFPTFPLAIFDVVLCPIIPHSLAVLFRNDLYEEAALSCQDGAEQGVMVNVS